jgi:alpha-galactosidase
MSSPKIVVLGAGSLFFGRKAIWQMVHSEHLRNGTLALVDIDETRLNKMATLAQKVIEHNKSPLKLEASTNRRDVLKGADFVILSFAYNNAINRGIDCDVSAKYGIRMCSGDTIGPGGIMRTMREFPVILDAAKDIQDLCPEAWVINYINPTSVHGIGLRRFFPKLKTFALCDAQYNLRNSVAKACSVENDDKLTLYTAGVNHFTWMLKADYAGKDLIPQLVKEKQDLAADEAAKKDNVYAGSKGAFNHAIGVQLYETMGYLPTVIGHTKEYVRFYQGLGITGTDPIPSLQLFSVPTRLKWTSDVWQRVDDYNSGKVNIAEFDTEFGPDPATDMIEAMWGNLGKSFFINTDNNGSITNMADDAFLELYCDLSMEGPKPHKVGPMPRGIRGMCELILDTHELTAQAVRDKDRNLLRRAFLTDPLTNSIGDTELLMDELIEKELEVVGEHWKR